MDFHQRYEFNPKTDLLGKGGFSKVYKATDTLLDRTVALKFFTGTLSNKYQVLNEIKKVIRFEHPNLCKYYDVALLTNKNVVGETEQIEVGIMEYIDAGDFKSYTRKNPQHVDKLLIDVLKGLAYLHRHGIAHRDLKPQNILVKTDEDEPISKITDFGISKVIASDDANSSTLLGTIEYMAPEQFNPKKYGINGRITTNLDLWSFGLLVYEAVCHESFFGSRSGGVSAEQVLANILSEATLAKADSLPAKYREIVKRCLVKNAAERVHNALELIPLFENKIIPVVEVRTKPEPENHKVSEEDTQVIEPGLPEKEVTQDAKSTQEMPVDDTQLLELAPDASTEKTQAIDPAPDITSEDTQAIERSQNPTEEITQAIEPVPDLKEEQPEVISSKEIKPVVKEDTAYVQPVRNKSEAVKPKPVKKIIALSSLAVLLIILVIAYPFLSQPNRSSETTPADTTSSNTQPPPVEDWQPELIQVSGGTFIMGTMDTNAVAPDFYPHQVNLTDFSLGKYEVSIAQFKKFIDETGYKTTAQQKGHSQIFIGGKWKDSSGIDWRYDVRGNVVSSSHKNIPVVHVSWMDADAYCKWLSEKTKDTYRLLTEAEWEFAARGGNNSKYYSFSGGDTINEVAWYQRNSDNSIHLIGTKKPNELGIYDMSGNALEWCHDWFNKDYYKQSPKENPKGPDSPARDSVKVLRGGAWAYEEKYSRNVQRTKLKADKIGGSTGFRVCKEHR